MNKAIHNFKEKKLLLAFLFLILLTLFIGLVGISQIQGLAQKIQDLGKNNLSLESAVLEMRINNANFATGVRNYIYWRSSRYLGALPMASSVDKIILCGENFKQQLQLYRQSAYLDQQTGWANQVQGAFDELVILGKKIIQLSDQDVSGKTNEAVNSLLMDFENRTYKIDEFLNNSLGKSNLAEIKQQMILAKQDKNQAILYLKFSLAAALILGVLITLAVYRRRLKERIYRQDLFNQMINIEEDERKRLSSAVHDEMGQDLSALKIYLGVIQQSLNNANPDLQEKINQCRQIIDQLLEKSHNIAFLLRPPDLDEIGLVDSLEALLLEYQHLTGVKYNYQKPQLFSEFSPEYSLLFYRITQELLTNTAKHAQAKEVKLKIEQNSENVKLFYRDDGKGFDCEKVIKNSTRRQEDKLRFGLLGLKERVTLLDGQMQINSVIGKGTNITVTLPL